MITVSRIWKQLTAYARERISRKLNEFYPDDSEELRLFNKMKDTTDAEYNAFMKEKTDHETPAGFLLDALKQGISPAESYQGMVQEMYDHEGSVYHLGC